MDSPAASTPRAGVSNQQAADIMNQLQGGRTCPPQASRFNLSLLPDDQARSWTEEGFFIIRGLMPTDVCEAMSIAVVDLFSRAESEGQSFNGHHVGDSGVIAVEEAALVDSGGSADQRMSKLFNLHRKALFRSFASHPAILNAMHAILGPDVSCFNSQYIFKNPGVWGQPWHQDSLYYRFDRMPQVGVWLATSRATVENGCLFVEPGSHLEPIHDVVPDARPGANFGYVEIIDYDFSRSVPVLMEPGDVLIFHSFLMHKSNDNTSNARRSALVYHYGHSATEVLGQKPGTIDFMSVLEGGRPVTG